jgi:hypothetical protein
MNDLTTRRAAGSNAGARVDAGDAGTPTPETTRPEAGIPLGPTPPTDMGGGEVPFVTRGTKNRTTGASITQTIPFAKDADKQATIAAFNAANGDDWFVAPLDTFGAMTHADNNAPVGHGPAVDAGKATQLAQAFLTNNAAFLGYTPEDLQNLKISPLPTNYGFSIGFEGTRSPPGYEGIDSIARQIAIDVNINTDGSIHSFTNSAAEVTSSNLIPGLAISTKPAIAPNSPSVTKPVIGRDLEWVTGGDEGQPKHVDKFGQVAAGDISSKKLAIDQDWSKPGQLTLTLAYDVRVQKGGHEWSFLIDAGTGKMIASGQMGA